jgi:hypothetical protein
MSYNPGTIPAVDTLAHLRDINSAFYAQMQTIELLADLKGNAGAFVWDAGSAATDDGVFVVKPTDVAGNGRLLRSGGLVLGPDGIYYQYNTSTSTWDPIGNLPGSVLTIADLTALDVTLAAYPVGIVIAVTTTERKGSFTLVDSPYTDDGGTILAPDVVSGNLHWERIPVGFTDFGWWNIDRTGATDNAAEFEAFLKATGVYGPGWVGDSSTTIQVASTVNPGQPFSIFGEGATILNPIAGTYDAIVDRAGAAYSFNSIAAKTALNQIGTVGSVIGSVNFATDDTDTGAATNGIAPFGITAIPTAIEEGEWIVQGVNFTHYCFPFFQSDQSVGTGNVYHANLVRCVFEKIQWYECGFPIVTGQSGNGLDETVWGTLAFHRCRGQCYINGTALNVRALYASGLRIDQANDIAPFTAAATAGSFSATLSAVGPANLDTVAIAGAGPNGSVFVGLVVSGGGTTAVTFAQQISTTVGPAAVCILNPPNGIYIYNSGAFLCDRFYPENVFARPIYAGSRAQVSVRETEIGATNTGTLSAAVAFSDTEEGAIEIGLNRVSNLNFGVYLGKAAFGGLTAQRRVFVRSTRSVSQLGMSRLVAIGNRSDTDVADVSTTNDNILTQDCNTFAVIDPTSNGSIELFSLDTFSPNTSRLMGRTVDPRMFTLINKVGNQSIATGGAYHNVASITIPAGTVSNLQRFKYRVGFNVTGTAGAKNIRFLLTYGSGPTNLVLLTSSYLAADTPTGVIEGELLFNTNDSVDFSGKEDTTTRATGYQNSLLSGVGAGANQASLTIQASVANAADAMTINNASIEALP